MIYPHHTTDPIDGVDGTDTAGNTGNTGDTGDTNSPATTCPRDVRGSTHRQQDTGEYPAPAPAPGRTDGGKAAMAIATPRAGDEAGSVRHGQPSDVLAFEAIAGTVHAHLVDDDGEVSCLAVRAPADAAEWREQFATALYAAQTDGG